jgi:GNAT superfamily N-acetyltransferase
MSSEYPTLFAGVDLARRVERAERSLIEEAARSTDPLGTPSAAVTAPIAGGVAVWAADGSPFNKVVGAGLDRVLRDDDLDAVEAMFDRQGSAVQFELSTLADPAVAEHLTRRGYALVGFENVLGLPLVPAPPARAAAGIDVRTVDPDDEADYNVWLEVDVEASSTPDSLGITAHEEFPREELKRAVQAMSSTSGFVASVAMIDGSPAGSGSLRLCDGVAQLCGAATLPRFRRRGVQTSLLSARLARAAAAGCELAVVTVQPGSVSQRNVQRLGFQLLYARSILVRSPRTVTRTESMLDEHITITGGTPTPDDVQFLEDRLYEYNSAHTGNDDGQVFAFFIRDEQNQIVAGLHGWTWAQACQIQNFWVRDELRGRGYGHALLERAESEARSRGCTVVALNSYSFQAAPFYRRHSYELVHQLTDFPPGHHDNLLVKRL